MCTGLACALARNAQVNAEALKMLNPTTQTMPIQGPYISDEELDRCDKAEACAHAVHPQVKDPALVDRQVPKEVHLEAKEFEQGQGIERGLELADPGKTGLHATEAKQCLLKEVPAVQEPLDVTCQ